MAVQAEHPDTAPRPQAGGDLRRRLEISLGICAALLLLLLVLVTCIDVTGRYLLNAPLTGAFELTEMLLAALVFTALPLATERREHVEVDLLAMALSDRLNGWMVAFGGLFSAAVLGTFGWRLATQALKAAEDGAVTNVLHIPLAPFGFLAAIACLISAVIALLRGLYLPRQNDGSGDQTEGTE